MTTEITLTPEQIAHCAQEAYRVGTYDEQNEIIRGIFRAECRQAARNTGAATPSTPHAPACPLTSSGEEIIHEAMKKGVQCK